MPLIRAAVRNDVPEAADAPMQVVRAAALTGDAEKLAEIAVAGNDPLAREAALTALARARDSRAIEALVRLIRIDDPALRNSVVETLQSMGEPVIDAIRPLLDDPNPNMRIYALNVLEGIVSPRSARVAMEVALADPHVNVCAGAVDVIAACGTPDMAAALAKVPARFPDHPFLAFAVRAALPRLG